MNHDPMMRSNAGTSAEPDLFSMVGEPTTPRARGIQIPLKRGHVAMAETSIAARREREAKGLKPQQLEVLRVVARGPCTSDDIVSATGMPANVVAPRLQELRAAGWVERVMRVDPKTGERVVLTRKTRAGTSAAVHSATASGLELLKG